MGVQMFARLDGAPAPRAGGELVGRADAAAHELVATGLLDRFDALLFVLPVTYEVARILDVGF